MEKKFIKGKHYLLMEPEGVLVLGTIETASKGAENM